MARYNREFLVPYLNNICALYIAKNRLSSWHRYVEGEFKRIDNTLRIDRPQKPEEEYILGVGISALFLILIGLFFFSLSFINTGVEDRASRLICLIISFICVISIVVLVRMVRKHNARRLRDYGKKCDAFDEYYNRLVENAEQEKMKLTRYLNAYQCEIAKIDALIDELYSANIIPSVYRNYYAAVYLYDWFGTSGADDLDHALSMYVLEEIKARLDRIIEQQSEMILNQRLMLAMQQESIEAQNRHSDLMQRKLDGLQATEDERLRYERMNEANTAATAFFAAATYLKY